MSSTSTTGVASGSAAPLRIVAISGELLSGTPAGEVQVIVNDASLVDARLLVDTGSGYVNGGVPLLTPGRPLMFSTSVTQRGTRYQVVGRRGSARVSSNEVVAAGYQPGTVRITSPGGDYTGFPNLIAASPGATWDGINGAARYLVILRRDAGFEWVATIGVNAYTWDEPYATTLYKNGTTPLPSGRHFLSVCALDASGWATHGSERRVGAASVPYGFEVQ